MNFTLPERLQLLLALLVGLTGTVVGIGLAFLVVALVAGSGRARRRARAGGRPRFG